MVRIYWYRGLIEIYLCIYQYMYMSIYVYIYISGCAGIKEHVLYISLSLDNVYISKTLLFQYYSILSYTILYNYPI